MEIDQKDDDDDDLNSSRVELEVIGIIRQRILFKTRPKALITSKLQIHKVLLKLLKHIIEA